tara:strand:+ start:366 stop:548 length:183 start_codon:yes stop_codon:yes gene_type:complete
LRVNPIKPSNPVAKHNRHRPQVIPAKKGGKAYDRKKRSNQHEHNQNQESTTNGKGIDTYA